MGVRPAPTVYGDSCILCWAAGKTPKYIKCFISGVLIGEEWTSSLGSPPNGYHDMRQVGGSPCWWTSLHPGPPWISYRLFRNDSELKALVVGDYHSFYDMPHRKCVRSFSSDLVGPEGAFFYGGYAHLSVPGGLSDTGGNPDHSLSSIVNLVTPMIDPDPRMECFPMADEQIAVRYAGKRDATNIMIKFDTDLEYWYKHFG